MNNKKIMIWAIGAIEVIAFVAFAIWVLVARNADMLFQAQNFSFFSSAGAFYDECMALPGGLVSWIASYLTQYLYEPALGAAVIVLLWLAALVMGKVALRVPMAWTGFMLLPLFALLTSVVDNGYWLYYIKQEGFWFYATVGFLFAMAMTLAATTLARITPEKLRVVTALAALILVSLTWKYFGVYASAAVLYIALWAAVDAKWQWKTAVPVIAVALLLVCVVPRIAYNYYADIRIEDLYSIGLPNYTAEETTSTQPMQPFYLLLALPLLMPLLGMIRLEKKAAMAGVLTVNAILIAGGAYFTLSRDFQDHNYHAEMRMYRALQEYRWSDALAEMEYLKEDPDRQMVMSKNVALINTGEIGSKMFAYSNRGSGVSNGFDTLHVHMVQTAAPLIYMYHGRTHFATRWCIENMVEFGKSFNDLKILSVCALVNGERELARKYLTMLSTSKYHKDWAARYMPITENMALIKKYREFDTIRELHGSFPSLLDSDAGLCEIYLLQTFSSSMSKDSKLFHELTLVYSMVQQDINLFWPRFFQHAQMHKGEEMPIHYQEAAYLYGQLENKVDISNMPFDKAKVIDRYNAFYQTTQQYLAQGMKEQDIADMTYSQFGDTFYWFYFFCRNLQSY